MDIRQPKNAHEGRGAWQKLGAWLVAMAEAMDGDPWNETLLDRVQTLERRVELLEQGNASEGDTPALPKAA